MMRSTAAAAGIIVEKNVAVPMSDGVTLRVMCPVSMRRTDQHGRP